MSEKVFKCHKISEGLVEGEALVSTDDIMFYLVDPQTGVVVEDGHALQGKSVAGKILVFPGGKGSSVVQADGLYQLMIHACAPKAMVIQTPETVLVACSIIMEIPMVDRLGPEFHAQIRDGDRLRVDADNGLVTIL